jgi:hypothetical protein
MAIPRSEFLFQLRLLPNHFQINHGGFGGPDTLDARKFPRPF